MKLVWQACIQCLGHIAGQKKNFKEIYTVTPGYKIFDVHIIGVPPISLAIEGNTIICPFTKPCHGTFLVSVDDEEEATRIRKENFKK